MAAIASLSDLVNRLSGGSSGAPETLFWYKTGRIAGTVDTAPVVGRFHSMWRYDGIQAAGGAAPTTVAIPTNSTAGSLGQTDPAGIKTKYLVGASAFGLTNGTVMLYDRLLHQGNLSGTVTTAQTVGGSITRNTGGVGNQIFVEIYTAIGATTTTVTASYTNSAGASGHTTTAQSFGGVTRQESSRMLHLPLQGGDVGVQSVQSVTVLATTGTAGTFGVTLVRPLAYVTSPAQAVGPYTSFIDGFNTPTIDSGACLAMAFSSGSTTGIEHQGCFTFVEA